MPDAAADVERGDANPRRACGSTGGRRSGLDARPGTGQNELMETRQPEPDNRGPTGAPPDPAHGFLALARRRRSVRAYRPDPVPAAVLARCLEAARLAPSSCNGQPWRFVVVDEPALKERVAALTADRWLPLNHFTRQAPVLVVLVMEPTAIAARVGSLVTRRALPWMDVGMAAEHFCLQAAAEGLGTCMLGWFHERAVRRLLGVPARRRVALILTVGFPADAEREPRRKPIAEIAGWNRY